MEPWVWALLLKPLGLAVFFCFVYAIAWVFWKVLPDGPIKRKLFSSIYRKKPSRSPHWGTKKT